MTPNRRESVPRRVEDRVRSDPGFCVYHLFLGGLDPGLTGFRGALKMNHTMRRRYVRADPGTRIRQAQSADERHERRCSPVSTPNEPRPSPPGPPTSK